MTADTTTALSASQCLQPGYKLGVLEYRREALSRGLDHLKRATEEFVKAGGQSQAVAVLGVVYQAYRDLMGELSRQLREETAKKNAPPPASAPKAEPATAPSPSLLTAVREQLAKGTIRSLAEACKLADIPLEGKQSANTGAMRKLLERWLTDQTTTPAAFDGPTDATGRPVFESFAQFTARTGKADAASFNDNSRRVQKAQAEYDAKQTRTPSPAKSTPAPAAAETVKVVTPALVLTTEQEKDRAAYRHLQAECKALGLPSKGTRDELAARIAEAKSRPQKTVALVVDADKAELLAKLATLPAETLAMLLELGEADTARQQAKAAAVETRAA